MKKLFSLYVLAVLLAPSAFAALPDFDQGVSVQPALESAKENAKEMTASAGFGEHYDSDCVRVTLGAEDQESGRFRLLSRIYREECHPAGPNGQMTCHDQLVAVESRILNLKVQDRQAMYPWEKDVFDVCLNGWWLSARVREASHDYKLQLPPTYQDGDILATALAKVPTLPDPNGIALTSFEPGTGDFSAEFGDKWAEAYAGEQVVLRVALKHDALFGGTLLEKEIALPAAASYKLRLADYAAEFNGKPKAGRKYLLKWSFKRVGPISKDAWVKEKKSDSKPLSATSLKDVDEELQTAALRTCTLRTIEADMCVYQCSSGGDYRLPVNTNGGIVCPQIVFPF